MILTGNFDATAESNFDPQFNPQFDPQFDPPVVSLTCLGLTLTQNYIFSYGREPLVKIREFQLKIREF